MKLQEAVTYILGNIGGRFDGRLGQGTPTEAAIQEINLAMREISKLDDPPEFQLEYDSSLSLGVDSFALPLHSGKRTRSIQSFFYQNGDFFHPVEYWHPETFFEKKNSSSEESNTLFCFTYFAGTIHVFPTPSEEITIKLYLTTYPPNLTGSDLNENLDIDPDWETSIIAYSTYKLFMRLQQREDAILWSREYEEAKKNAMHALRKRRMEPDYRNPMRAVRSRPNPQFDPFVRSWK